MARTRSRITRRRHIRVLALDRPTALYEPPAPGRLASGAPDPREFRSETGMRPYEIAYDVSDGYAGERPILLP
jgi:hypothetical protein